MRKKTTLFSSLFIYKWRHWGMLSILLCLAGSLSLSAQTYFGNLVISSDTDSDLATITPGTTTVTGNLVIRDNVTDAIFLNPLIASITTVQGNLRIVNATFITTTAGLGVTSVGNNVVIRNNDELINLDGLCGLTEVPNNLIIDENDKLMDMDCLQNITSVGSNLTITDNGDVVDINTALSGLASMGGAITVGNNVTITDNPDLVECCILICLRAGGSTTIADNETGCNSLVEILDDPDCLRLECEDTEIFLGPILGLGEVNPLDFIPFPLPLNAYSICGPYSLEAIGPGLGTLLPNPIDGFSFINTDLVSCEDLGDTQITITFTDENGNVVNCVANAEVIDDIEPIIFCEFFDRNVEATVDERCDAYVCVPTPFVFDNCTRYDNVVTFADALEDALEVIFEQDGLDELVDNFEDVVTAFFEGFNPEDYCEDPDTDLDDDLGDENISWEIIEYDNLSETELYESTSDETDLIEIFGTIEGKGHAHGIYPVGLTTIRWVAVDESGNESEPCFTTVRVKDKVPPVIVCPEDYYEGNEGGGEYIVVFETEEFDDDCDALVCIQLPEFSDNCLFDNLYHNLDGVDQPIAPFDQICVSGTLDVGEYVMNWTGTDASGNMASCQIRVIVEDKTAPQIFCPADRVVEHDNELECGVDGFSPDDLEDQFGAGAGYPELFENCPCPDDEIVFLGSLSPFFEGPAPDELLDYEGCAFTFCDYWSYTCTALGGTSPTGTISRSWYVKDDAGNISSCIQILDIVDTEAPILVDGYCPPDLPIGDEVILPNPSTGTAVTEWNFVPLTPFYINPDNYFGTPISWLPPTAEDICSDEVTRTICVTQPNGGPTIICLGDETTIPPFLPGISTVCYKFEDACGNKNTECCFEVEVASICLEVIDDPDCTNTLDSDGFLLGPARQGWSTDEIGSGLTCDIPCYRPSENRYEFCGEGAGIGFNPADYPENFDGDPFNNVIDPEKDQFCYLNRAKCDCVEQNPKILDLKTTVVAMSCDDNVECKAGLVIREDYITPEGARNVSLIVQALPGTTDYQVVFQYRDEVDVPPGNDGETTIVATAIISSLPVDLYLSKSGDSYTAYYATGGVPTLLGSPKNVYGISNYFFGMGASSGNTSSDNCVIFEDYSNDCDTECEPAPHHINFGCEAANEEGETCYEENLNGCEDDTYYIETGCGGAASRFHYVHSISNTFGGIPIPPKPWTPKEIINEGQMTVDVLNILPEDPCAGADDTPVSAGLMYRHANFVVTTQFVAGMIQPVMDGACDVVSYEVCIQYGKEPSAVQTIACKNLAFMPQKLALSYKQFVNKSGSVRTQYRLHYFDGVSWIRSGRYKDNGNKLRPHLGMWGGMYVRSEVINHTASANFEGWCGEATAIQWKDFDFEEETGDEVLNLENLSELSISAMPNPFSQHLNVLGTVGQQNGSTLDIKVFNYTGQQVYTRQLTVDDATDFNTNLDLGDLPSGVYLIEAQSGEERTMVRVVKQ